MSLHTIGFAACPDEAWLEALEAQDPVSHGHSAVLAAIEALDPSVRFASSVPPEWMSENLRARFMRYSVIAALGSIAPESPEVADAIVSLAGDKDPWTRRTVAMQLPRLVKTTAVVTAMRQLAVDGDSEVAGHAGRALREYRAGG